MGRCAGYKPGRGSGGSGGILSWRCRGSLYKAIRTIIFPETPRFSSLRTPIFPMGNDLSLTPDENRFLCRKSTCFEVLSRRSGGDLLDDLLLEDLLHGGLLAALVLFLGRQAVSAGVTHDRVAGDHRPARGARDLAGLALRGLFLHPVSAGVTHDRVGGDHRPARRTGDLPRLFGFLHLRDDRGGLRRGNRAHRLRRGPRRGLHGRGDGLRSRRRRGLRVRLWRGPLCGHCRSSRRGRNGLRGRASLHRCGGGRNRRSFPGGRRPDALLARDESPLSLREPALIVRHPTSQGSDGLLFLRESLLAGNQVLSPLDLIVERRLLVVEKFDDVLLPGGDLAPPGRELLARGREFGVATVEVLLALHERLHAAGDLLLSLQELLFLREGPLLGSLELLLPLCDRPVLLLEVLLPRAEPLLSADEGVALLRHGGPLLLEALPLPLELLASLLEARLALREFLLLDLQGLLRLAQKIRDRRDSRHSLRLRCGARG